MITLLISANVMFAVFFSGGVLAFIRAKHRAGSVVALAAVVTNALSAYALYTTNIA